MANYLRVFYCLHNLMKSAYWTHDNLVEYQNRKLRQVVKYAYDNVPFYHKKLNSLRIKPNEINTTADLNKLPVLKKGELRETYKGMVSRRYDVNRLRRISTSGSTGQPLSVYISREEDEFRKAKHLRANISVGQKMRDRWVVITAPHHFGEATKFQRMLGVYAPLSLSVFNDIDSQITMIEKVKPAVLDGYSSALLLLSHWVNKRGSKVIRPRVIIGGAELIGDSSRQFVEEAFAAPFFDQYACVEFERLAWQCPSRVGYHMDADSVVMQFLDKDGEEVSSGERGEIVCTSLFNFAMPLIRYDVGDVGIPSHDVCSCGRSLPLMKVVEGRSDSLLFLADGRILSPRMFTVAMSMFSFYDHIDQYRVVQKKLDYFEIYVKIGGNSVDEQIVEQLLVHHLRNLLDIKPESAALKVKFVDDLQLDRTGKFRIVVSELPEKLEKLE